jgi:hypothetical protein
VIWRRVLTGAAGVLASAGTPSSVVMVVASMKPLAMLRCVWHIMSHANGASVSLPRRELSVVVIVHDTSGRGPRVRVIQLNGGRRRSLIGAAAVTQLPDFMKTPLFLLFSL